MIFFPNVTIYVRTLRDLRDDGYCLPEALPSKHTESDDTQALRHSVPKAGSMFCTW